MSEKMHPIEKKILEYPTDMNLYHPNLCTWLQTDVRTMRERIENMLSMGTLKKMKTIRYKNQVMSEYTVEFDKEFDWENMQDPDDYMPIEKCDCEIVTCYRTVK